MATRAAKPAKKPSPPAVRAPVMGLDFGTSSVRALIVDALTGETLAPAAATYPHGLDGVITSKTDPHLARQDPHDYRDAREHAMRSALRQSRRAHRRYPSPPRA